MSTLYYAHLLGMHLTSSFRDSEHCDRTRMVKLEGVDKLLRGIAAYRKRDPADSEDIHLPAWNCMAGMQHRIIIASNTLSNRLQEY